MSIFDRIKGLFGGDKSEPKPTPSSQGASSAALYGVPGWSGPDVEDEELAERVVAAMKRVSDGTLDKEAFDDPEFGAELDAIEGARAFNDLVEILRRALQSLPRHPPLLLRLARAYTQLYDNASAASLWRRLVEMGEEVAEANYTLGELAEREESLVEAAAYYQRAMAEDVSFANAWQRAERLKGHLPIKRRAAVTVGGVDTGASSGGPGLRPPAGFELDHPLGRGGYGTVFLARDTRLHREVAIKFLHPHLTQDSRRATSFFEEARLVARLGLPGVVRIYDLDPEDKLIVMEYLPRGTLRDRLSSGRPLSLRAALRVVMALTRTLSRLHAQGLIHRDIKPENILFRADGTPVLGDFGVATLESGAVDSRAAGTVAYMAPEQKQSAASIDRRVDLYAVGLVLVEMVSGVMPASVGVQPAESWIGLVPRASRTLLAPILRRLLAVDPDQRAMDARQVYTELATLRRQVLGREQAPELIEELERLAELGGGGPESAAFIAMVKRELGVVGSG